jgi:hypothetical protein
MADPATQGMTDLGSAPRRLAICLAGLGAALIAVGVSGGTLLRHAIQIVPIAVALAVVTRRPRWAAYGALPIFAIWILISVLIWLYLLGVARVITGTFSPTEIICTIFMVGFSSIGAGPGLGTASRSDGRSGRSSC